MDHDKELKIRFSARAQRQLEEHPEAGEGLREAIARMRQALEGIDLDNREAVDEAMNSIGAEHVTDPDLLERLDPLMDDYDDASFAKKQ